MEVRVRIGFLPLAVAALILALLGPASAQDKVAGTYGQGPEVFTLATGSPARNGVAAGPGRSLLPGAGRQDLAPLDQGGLGGIPQAPAG